MGGISQWRTTWRRSQSSGQSAYSHVKAFELVDRIVLPGTSSVGGADGATPQEHETSIAWVSEAARSITRPDGLVVTVDLNAYGNVKTEALGLTHISTDWYSDTVGAKVQPSVRVAPGGRSSGFESTDDGRMRPTGVRHVAASASDVLPVAGIAPGASLSGYAQHDGRFGTPAQTTRPTASGSGTFATPVNPATGDVQSVTVTDSRFGTLASQGVDEYDGDGVVVQEHDPVGRVTMYSGVVTSEWGTRPRSTTTLSVTGGGLGSVMRERSYDAFGRVNRVTDSVGHDEQWDYDGAGRLLRHEVFGDPPERWTYEYPPAGDRELVVRELLNGEFVRERLYRDGMVVRERWAHSGGTATRTFTYVRGRLDAIVDDLSAGTLARRYERRHIYDERGRLQRIETSTVGAQTPPVVEAEFTLDDEGKTLSQKDHNGQATAIAYDVLGRPARWDHGPASPAGNDRDVETVTRDANGAVVERKHGSYTWTYQVDALGRVQVEQALNRTGEVNSISHYDGLGRKTYQRDEVMGVTENWEYADVLGRPTVYRRSVDPYTGEYREDRRYSDDGSVHSVLVTETLAGRTLKTRTLWLDAMGRTLHVRESVPGPNEALVQSDRYFAYDPRGNVVKEWSPIGDGPTDGQAQATTATTALLRRTFDAAGNLTASVDAKGFTTSYTHYGDGTVATQVGPAAGESWTREYDAFGQLTRKVLASPGQEAGWKGGTWTYVYRLADGTTVKETDPLGYETSRRMNARGKLLVEVLEDVGTTRSSPNERRTEITYDGPWPSKQVTTEGRSVATVSRPSHDHRGRVLREIEEFTGPETGAAYTYTTEWPWNGRVATPIRQTWTTANETGERAQTGTQEVDGLGNVISQAWGTFADTWTYDAAGRLNAELLAGKQVSRTWRYVEGRVTRVSFDSEHTGYAYWASGRVRTETRPDGRQRQLTWNERGLLELELFGSGTEVERKEFGYDASGNVASLKHGPLSDLAQWTWVYGPRRELTSVTQPDAGVFSYGYDERALLARITPPAGSGMPERTFEHDYLGREVRRTRGVSATWNTAWTDGAGVTVEPVDGRFASEQRSLRRVLDGRRRVSLEEYGGAPSDLTKVLTEYDPLDQPLRMTETRGSGDVTTRFTYGDPRQLVTEIRRGTQTISYPRTASGQVDRVTSPAGTVSYGYDRLDRLGTIGGTTLTWEAGGERLLDLTDGARHECRRYYGQGWLRLASTVGAGDDCEAATSPLARFRYTYDPRGNRLTEEYQAGAGAPETTDYGYDKADRLTGVRDPSGSAKLYLLGGDGSRLREKDVPGPYAGLLGPTDYGTPTGVEQVYGYDPQGGLTSIATDGTTVASWTVDLAGRVRTESRGGVTKTFGWDAGGRLVSATVAGGGTPEAIGYRYDGLGRRIEKTSSAGTATWLWGLDGLVEEGLAGGGTVLYERAGELVSAVRMYPVTGQSTHTVERLIHDGLGSVAGRVRTDGTLAAAYRYDAWGSFRGTGAPGNAEATLAYAGQHWDRDLGLSYAQQRWYRPETGRFLSEDPVFGDLANPNSLQVFGYGNGNPLLFTDPRGTQSTTNDIGLALMWQQVGAELSAMWEAMVGGKAHVLPAQNHVEWTPPKGGVGGMAGGVVRTASLRLIPMEQNPSQSSKLGMEVGAGVVPFLNPAEKLVTGETVTGEPTSRFWAAVELGLDAAPLVPKAYKAATKALGGEARAARAASSVPGDAGALRKATWEDFRAAAWERQAAVKQEYGDLGLQMSLGGDREAAQRAAAARAGAEGAVDELAKMRQDLGLPPAGSENDVSALAKLEVEGKSFFGINAHGQPVSLKVNPISRTHAETDVFQQAANAGVKGGRGRLVVDRDLCTACGAKGAVNSMARQLGIEQLEVVTPGEVAILPKP